MKLNQLQEARTLQSKYVQMVIDAARSDKEDEYFYVDKKDISKVIDQLNRAFGPSDEGSFDFTHEGERMYRYVWSARIGDHEATIQFDNDDDGEPMVYIEVIAGPY